MLYADHEMWLELYDIYERMSQVTTNESALADLLAKMATLSSECLNDITKASELWSKVVDIRGEDTQVLEALAELHAKQQNWSELVDILERAVGIAEDDETRVRIYSSARHRVGRAPAARSQCSRAWENVLTIEPRQPARAQGDRQDPREQPGVGPAHRDDRADHRGRLCSFEPEELRDYLRQAGQASTPTPWQQPIDAIDAWRHAHEVDPSDLRSLAALRSSIDPGDVGGAWSSSSAARRDPSRSTMSRSIRCSPKPGFTRTSSRSPLRAKTSYLRILDAAPLHGPFESSSKSRP